MGEKSNKYTHIANIIGALMAPLIAGLLFFCFEWQIDDWLWSFNSKWLMHCHERTGGVLIILLILMTVWHLYDKCRKTILSVNHAGWLIAFFVVYVYYSRIDHTFYFWGFPIGGFHVAYLDFAIIPLLQLFFIQYRLLKNRNVTECDGKCIIDQDEPIEKYDEDFLGMEI